MQPADLERFRNIEEVFHAALEAPAGEERDAFIRRRCDGDGSLQAQVFHLLNQDERVRTAVPPVPERMPRFGAWQTIKLLGRGGMGTVYLADRADGAFRMSAAVKIVPMALASPAIEERFRRERQFLAGLDHPKIARLIDGGVSEGGLPYLVMEYVDGLTIEKFCEAGRLDPRARISLVRQVLEALAYVHGQQVIHRDLKASNILVGDAGQVKLLDFGTARLVDATAEAALTKTGVFAFTPEYASPEQVRGESLTFATDLYSAGVLLFRLLTGRFPYRIADASPAVIAELIARSQPEPSRLDARLDAILSKALIKNPAGRYASAGDMDADLARYLEGQKVRARRPRKKFRMGASVVLILAACAILTYRATHNAQELVPFDPGVPYAQQPALSHDGKWLAFASPGKTGSHPQIWIKPMPNGMPKRVTDSDSVDDEPSLSPDGRWMAFHSKRAPEGIYLQSSASDGITRPPRLLVAGGRVPRFSPDGRWIAFQNASEIGGDVPASNIRRLFLVPSQGGAPVRLAKNASTVQGAAWSADSNALLYLSTDVFGSMGLWTARLDGSAASETPDFDGGLQQSSRACAITGERLIYTNRLGSTPRLGEFLLKPRFGLARWTYAGAIPRTDLTGCTASADGLILADHVDYRSTAWTLPIDPETGLARGPLSSLNDERHGGFIVQSTPDGRSLLLAQQGGESFLQDARTGKRAPAPGLVLLSSDGLFGISFHFSWDPGEGVRIRNLKTGESWGPVVAGGVSWSLSAGGKWLLAATMTTHRGVVAWDTKTGEHQVIYADPNANLYVASFSRDGRWVIFTSEDRGRHARMWAAPFRELESVTPAEWVDLGEGDYPRWSPSGGRIYFTLMHNGFECIFTRAVDTATKQPTGPVSAVQHFHDRWTVLGMNPGSFRISVAQDKLAFPLGEPVHEVLRLR